MEVERIRPIGRRVLVRPCEWVPLSDGGLHLPEVSEERGLEAVVVRLGDGKCADGVRRPFRVMEGQCVAVSRWGGAEIELDRARHVFVHEDDIIGLVALRVAGRLSRPLFEPVTQHRKPA